MVTLFFVTELGSVVQFLFYLCAAEINWWIKWHCCPSNLTASSYTPLNATKTKPASTCSVNHQVWIMETRHFSRCAPHGSVTSEYIYNPQHSHNDIIYHFLKGLRVNVHCWPGNNQLLLWNVIGGVNSPVWLAHFQCWHSQMLQQ